MRRVDLVRHLVWMSLACSLSAHAQPNRPVRLIVPFAAGSVNDLVARVIAAPLGDALGQQLVIDNRAGAAGNVAAEVAAGAAPDGYTLFMGNVSHVKNRFNATDLAAAPSTPDQLAAFLRAEIAKWGKVVKGSGMRSE